MLAEGIFQWVTQEQPETASDTVALFLVEGEQPSGKRGGQHVVVGVQVNGNWLYLDGDGVSTEATLLHRWETQERVKKACLAPFDPSWLDTAQICQRPDISHALAWMLQQHFGQFHPQDLRTEAVCNGEEAQLRPEVGLDLGELLFLLSIAQPSLPTWDSLMRNCWPLASRILQLLPPILVRVRALTQQYSPTGPLLFTPLCVFPFRAGSCDLCGNPLGGDEHYRCALCVLAANLLLGYQTLEAWLQSESLIG